MNNNQIDTIISQVNLTDNYIKSNIKNNLGDHIFSVLDLAVNCGFNLDSNTKFSNKLYWESISKINERYDNDDDDELNEYLDLLEDRLYDKILSELGRFYDSSNVLLINSIDFSIQNLINKYKFDTINEIDNPFKNVNKILEDRNLIYSFSNDLEYLRGFRQNNPRVSELVNDLDIGVVSKCKKPKFSINFIKDMFGLRRLFLEILSDESRNSTNPIKFDNIVAKFRHLGISETELSDNNIKNKIIKPLKNTLQLGSNKEGYFIIQDYNDLLESYKSHFNNYMGFINTLEKHKKLARTNEYSVEEFNRHLIHS